MHRLLFALLALPVLSLTACDNGDPDDPGAIRRIVITEVELESAPLTDNGNNWDGGVFGVGEEPDIYFDLVNDDTGTPVLATPVEAFGDVESSDFPLVWSATPGSDEQALPELVFTRFTTPLAFDLYDDDNPLTKGDDDFMGSTEAFTLQTLLDMTTPPTLFTVESADGAISLRLRLRYER